MIRNLQQSLVFFILSICWLQTNNISSSESISPWQTYLDNKTEEEVFSEDEQLLLDLNQITSEFYKKIIETAALYFAGMIKNSDQFQKQLVVETSKYFFTVCKIITQHVSMLLKNSKISWKTKIKRSLYISSFLIVMIIWMKEFHKPEIQDSYGSTYRHMNLHKLEEQRTETQNFLNLDPRPESERF